MNADTLRRRAAERLSINEFNAMQQAMASQPLPARILLLAPTGAGKTLAYTIPFLASLSTKVEGIKGVVIAPTRELVLQIYEVVRTLAAPDFKVAAFYGGHNMQAEKASLTGNPDIIVATPGRLLDHIQRGNISLYDMRSLVLDEYDKSLELGFHDQMRSIMGRMRKVSTLILTSATQAAELPDFVDGSGITTLDFFNGEAVAPKLNICNIHSDCADKLDTLAALLRKICGTRTIVFVNHREAAERVATGMQKAGIKTGLYHGALDQDMRERALILFENGTTPVLAATDLAARGLDIDGVDAVVHYHLPIAAENWTHRNGRTGRQGADGKIFVITSDADKIQTFVTWDSTVDTDNIDQQEPLPRTTTLYINAGRKEKISRGDIAGYILRNSGLEGALLGRIDIRDHCAYAGVPANKARDIIEALKPFKLKGHKVRVSQIKQ